MYIIYVYNYNILIMFSLSWNYYFIGGGDEGVGGGIFEINLLLYPLPKFSHIPPIKLPITICISVL